MNETNANVVVMDHPLILHKLSLLRDRDTNVRDFRALCTEITMLIKPDDSPLPVFDTTYLHAVAAVDCGSAGGSGAGDAGGRGVVFGVAGRV